MRKNPNKSYYHLYTEITDSDTGEVSIEYYMTQKELADTLGVCTKTIYNKIHNPKLKLRYYKDINMKIIECYMPTTYEIKINEDQKDMIRTELY